MKLSKALKIKNKLKGNIAKMERIIRENNSVLEGAVRHHDINEINKQLHEAVERLIILKTAINKANLPIQEKIYRLSELKNKIAFLSTVPTKEGSFPKNYGDGETVMVVTINEAAISNTISFLEDTIETLQEEIDTYNFTTEIDVDI